MLEAYNNGKWCLLNLLSIQSVHIYTPSHIAFVFNFKITIVFARRHLYVPSDKMPNGNSRCKTSNILLLCNDYFTGQTMPHVSDPWNIFSNIWTRRNTISLPHKASAAIIFAFNFCIPQRLHCHLRQVQLLALPREGRPSHKGPVDHGRILAVLHTSNSAPLPFEFTGTLKNTTDTSMIYSEIITVKTSLGARKFWWVTTT